MEKKQQTVITLGLELLAVLFIALKLTKQIDWPWVWVLAPIWATWLLVITIVLMLFLINLFQNNLQTLDKTQKI